MLRGRNEKGGHDRRLQSDVEAEGDKVLDAGSGTGSFSATIARMTKEPQNQIEI